jgi:hypothetical protein
MIYDIDLFDTLDCSHCENPTPPKRVTNGPTVSYKCKDCGCAWRINENGDEIYHHIPKKTWLAYIESLT